MSEVADRLAKGIPADPNTSTGITVGHADIVNAAWMIRLGSWTAEVDKEAKTSTSLQGGGVSRTRITQTQLDRLANFSSESVEFVKVWEKARRDVADILEEDPADEAKDIENSFPVASWASAGGSLLSGAALAKPSTLLIPDIP